MFVLSKLPDIGKTRLSVLVNNALALQPSRSGPRTFRRRQRRNFLLPSNLNSGLNGCWRVLLSRHTLGVSVAPVE